jgi:molybdenum cofactor biosynthesis enzyme MoaA
MTRNERILADYKAKCAENGIKIVRDSFDSKDENLEKERRMIKEWQEESSIFEELKENWKSIFLQTVIFISVVASIYAIFFTK